MPYRCAFIALCLVATHALAIDDPIANLKKGQPEDVKKLIDRISDCNHWAGEEAYDAERKREIWRAVKRLKCDRLEKDEVAARKRYAKQPGVLKALQDAKE